MSNAVTDLHGWSVEAEHFLAAILESVAQPIWVVDPEGVIRFANPAAVAALGYDTADELLGCPSHETIHHSRPDGTDFPAADCPMLLPRITGERVARDLDWFFRRDGSGFPVSYVSVPIALDEGRGAVVAFTPREREATLAEERAALLRVATLVAGGAAAHDVLAAVAREIGELLDLPAVEMSRLDPGGASSVVVGAWGRIPHPFQVGTRWRLEGPTVSNEVLRTGRTARVDDYEALDSEMAAAVRSAGVHSAVGVPIVVEGELWGVLATGALVGESLPDDIEERLEEFTRLLAAAISNTQAREELDRVINEQSALRRIATLVAQDADPGTIFDAVCVETGRIFEASTVNLARFTDDGLNVTMAGWSHRGVHIPTGSVLPLEGESINNLVRETRAPGRYDTYERATGPLAARLRELGVRSEVGAPVLVDGRVWGALIVGTDDPEPLPVGVLVPGHLHRLQPGGHLVIWVPAFQFLYSRFDEKLGHERRYTKGQLDGDVRLGGVRGGRCPVRERGRLVQLALDGAARPPGTDVVVHGACVRQVHRAGRAVHREPHPHAVRPERPADRPQTRLIDRWRASAIGHLCRDRAGGVAAWMATGRHAARFGP